MKNSNKMLWIGLVIGVIPPIGVWIFNIPEGPWFILNPIGLILAMLSIWVRFIEKYKIVSREDP